MKLSCFEFRQLLGAEPQRRDAAVAEHKLACSSCAAFAGEQLALDAKLQRALYVPVPEALAPRIVFAATRRPRRRLLWATAALLVAGLGAGWLGWQTAETVSLPVAVVEHVQHEPDLLMLPTSLRVEREHLVKVMDWGGARLTGDPGAVSYAGLCMFRGDLVAHLVVPTAQGPVTVMLLPKIHIQQSQPFDESGFRGVLVPLEQGTIAIISGRSAPPPEVARRFVAAVSWQT